MTSTKHQYVCRGFKSLKAIFFVTEKSLAGNFGFWAPKKHIIKDRVNEEVFLPTWFKPKIIQVD